MKILIVSFDYPHIREERFPFVKQLVEEFARQGHECCVLSPYNIIRNRHFYSDTELSGIEDVKLVRPNYLSFGRIKIGNFSPSSFFHHNAIKKGLNNLPFVPDVIYCHFWEMAIVAYQYAKDNKIPLFVATGESKIILNQQIPEGFCDYVNGVISVCSKNREESIELGLTTMEKCIVLPNAIDPQKFFVIDKMECRKKLGFSEDDFIVAFVGWFNVRKGSKRLSDALSKIENVKSVFIGNGPDVPTCSGILYKGSLPHNEIVNYLNASDIFVLPTLAEGCCNAVVEAMACGLPIVSSNLSFNWDVLDKSNSIMVNPNDVDGIANAIISLRENSELKEKLREGSIKKASYLTIENRASAILDFMGSRL